MAVTMVKVVDTMKKTYPCPRGCGPLKHGRSMDIISKTTHCKKCKGIMLTKDEIKKWENKRAGALININKMKQNNLFALLNSGTTGTLDCPKCHTKMKEIHLGYKKSRMMSRHEEIAKDPKRITGEMALEFFPIFGALIQFGRFISEVGADAKKGKLKKTVTIDGCSSCFTFWFDRGEIIQITGNNVTLEYKGAIVRLAGPNAKPSPNVITAHKATEDEQTKDDDAAAMF
jgi:Zn-finger nucleic acid-binding protein